MAQDINADLRNGKPSILQSLPKLANLRAKGFHVIVDFRKNLARLTRAPDKKAYVNVFLPAADLKNKKIHPRDVLYPGENPHGREYKRIRVSKVIMRDLYDYKKWRWIEEVENIDPKNDPAGEVNVEGWGGLTISDRVKGLKRTMGGGGGVRKRHRKVSDWFSAMP